MARANNFRQWKGAMKGVELRANTAIESALDEQAELLTRLSGKQAPKDSGVMRASTETDRGITTKTVRTRRVSYNTPYAAYQHEGKRRDGTHVVRNYTTPGTKKFYLKDPLNRNTGKWVSLVVKNFKKMGF